MYANLCSALPVCAHGAVQFLVPGAKSTATPSVLSGPSDHSQHSEKESAQPAQIKIDRPTFITDWVMFPCKKDKPAFDTDECRVSTLPLYTG